MEEWFHVEVTPKEKQYKHFENLNQEGGLKLDIEADSNFLTNTKNLMVDLGSKALKGTLDLSDMTLPASMLGKFNRLEVIALEYPYLCRYLSHAAKAADPVERMKWIVAGCVASTTAGIQVQKATPPIPVPKGEKLEGYDKGDNRILLEHDSNKQDVTKVLVEGKDGEFKIECNWENVIKFRGLNVSNVAGKKAQPKYITFKNGDKITLTPGEYELDGAMAASKVFRMIGQATITDEANKITAIIKFIENPKKGMLSGITGFFGKQKPAEVKPEDLNKIEIEIKKEDKVVSKGSGNWTSYVEIDDHCYWKCTDPRPEWNFEHASVKITPSERTRKLKQLILDKKYQEADTLMEQMKKPAPEEPKKEEEKKEEKEEKKD